MNSKFLDGLIYPLLDLGSDQGAAVFADFFVEGCVDANSVSLALFCLDEVDGRADLARCLVHIVIYDPTVIWFFNYFTDLARLLLFLDDAFAVEWVACDLHF